jgi:hypothetical protein
VRIIARLLTISARLGVTSLLLVVASPFAVLYAQAEPDAALVSALRTVVDFARNDFEDLRGLAKSIPGSNRWSVPFPLPGFKECYLVHEPADARKPKGLPLPHLGDRFWYGCDGFLQGNTVEDGHRGPSLAARDRLLTAVEQATGWGSTDISNPRQRGKIFDAFGGPTIVVYFYGADLRVFPPNIVSRPGSASTGSSEENQIMKEIERIESAGDASPMPAPLTSDRVSSGSNVGRILDNRTAYVLIVLLTGPVNKRSVLPAGTKQTFEIPPGRYKVAARLLAPDFPPLFGVQEYVSGHDYKSDFVIE